MGFSYQIRPPSQIAEIATSTLYSFLNHITLIFRDSTPNDVEAPSYTESRNSMDSLAITVDMSARTFNDNQKQQVCVNAIEAIAGVTCHLKDDKVNIFVATSGDFSQSLSFRFCPFYFLYHSLYISQYWISFPPISLSFLLLSSYSYSFAFFFMNSLVFMLLL